MDFIIGLPPNKYNENVYDFILIVINCYIKMAQYILTEKIIDIIQLAGLFYNKIIFRFGVPNDIISDKGSVFINIYWSEFCFDIKIK